MRHIDANRVGSEIDAIGGTTTTQSDLIAAGVGGTGELAKCFTQDRDEAAQKRWRDEADYVMRSLVPVIVNTRTEEERPSDKRVWVPVYSETNDLADAGTYRRVTEVLPANRPTIAKPDRQLEGWAMLMEWREKYGDDPMYVMVIEAIDALMP